MSTTQIRQYKEEKDREGVRALFLRGMTEEDPSFQHPFHHQYVQKSLEGDLQDIPQHYLKNPDSNFWVAVRENAVVGFVGLSSNETEDQAELVRLQVDSEFRRLQIASKLLETLETFARSKAKQRIVLSTITLHKKAAQFYKRHGFFVTQEKPLLSVEGDIKVLFFEKSLI